MNKAAKFLALNWHERWGLAYAMGALWRAWFGLRTVSFDRLRDNANRPAATATANALSPERIAWAVIAMSRFVPDGSNCLIRALASARMLRRYGYDATLQIGVTKAANGGINAHAWLESGGQVVIGGFVLDRYVTLRDARTAA